MSNFPLLGELHLDANLLKATNMSRDSSKVPLLGELQLDANLRKAKPRLGSLFFTVVSAKFLLNLIISMGRMRVLGVDAMI